MRTPSAREVREAVADLLAEVAWAQAPDGLLADLQVAVLAGNIPLALTVIRRTHGLFAVIEAALGAVQCPEEDDST